jgi:transglutaminase-like putative cysteine protease
MTTGTSVPDGPSVGADVRADAGTGTVDQDATDGTGPALPRLLALGSTAVLLFSVLVVLFEIIDIVGDPQTFLAVVAATLVLATAFAQVVRARTAVLVCVVLLGLGVWTYANALGVDVFAAQGHVVDDVVAMVTGLSVLRLKLIELWVLAVTPGPVFLTWFLVVRRRYLGAATVGGGTLAFFVLTGDADPTMAMLGVLGATGTVGFSRLERFGGDTRGVEALAVVFAAMVVVTMTVSVVPGGTGQPIQLFGQSEDRTMEGNLLNDDQRLTVVGSIELSPEVRFTVESEEPAYWRAAAYDRYTGDGWVRTGSGRDYPGRLPGPPGRTETITQEYVVESDLAVMPAAWRPVSVSGADGVQVSDMGGLQPTDPFSSGDRYTVTSHRPVASDSALRRASEDYPDRIEDRYTRLPASTPDRVDDRTDEITAGADNPYDTASAIESWLEDNREYSLDVDRPSGDVADSFLFEMEAGYCTYYATTMVTMLRTQGIPARFTVGYTSGERVDDDEYLIRGLDSHAWVEVYFPEHGWVNFDPTPAGPRQAAEQDRLVEAGVSDGDDGTVGPATTTTTTTTRPTTTTTTTTTRPDDRTVTTTATEPTTTGSTDTATPSTTRDEDDGGLGLPALPSREQVALLLVVVAGVVAASRRTGAAERVYRAVWLRWQPRADPAADVERAFERVEYLLGRTHRPRAPGETRRAYLDDLDVDDRVEAVYSAYERARYAGEVSQSLADETVRLANQVVGDRTGPFG